MHRQIILIAAAVSIAGLWIVNQSHHNPADQPSEILSAPSELSTGKTTTTRHATPKPEDHHLMDSTILIEAANPALSADQKFQILWSAYQRNKSSDEVASYYLDSLVSISPVPHVDKLISELNNAMTSPELQRHLMRLLETAYRDRNEGNVNGVSQNNILDVIQAKMNNDEDSVANEAVDIYSRQANPELAISALKTAHESHVINDSEFIHDIFFKIPAINDPTIQNALVSQMIILAAQTQTPEAANALVGAVGVIFEYTDHIKLNDQTSSALRDFLIKNEPQFIAGENTQYEMLTAADYCSWLNSYAKAGNKSENETLKFMLETLTSNATDPKKIIAVLLSNRGQNVVHLARQEGRLTTLQNSLKIALLQLPQGFELFDLTQSALNSLN